ncbi:MAG: YdeI/OmpD-associated family protein [Polyangiaceae bacterium]
MTPRFFRSPTELERWLVAHHETDSEIIIGFYKAGSDAKGITYREALDLALAYGWIDGVRKSIDATRWMIRFTPRKKTSIWSAVNIARVAELEAEGRMKPAGRAAFERRSEARSRVYSFERETPATLEPAERAAFEKKKRAWAFFTQAAPSYQRTATHWVVSAKKPETRARRLAQLIACSAAGERLPHLTPRRPAR